MIPRTGVFVYPRDFKSTSKKPSIGAGQQWRHLMSVFYTSKELIDRGNSMGVNGKEGLSKEIVKAMHYRLYGDKRNYKTASHV